MAGGQLTDYIGKLARVLSEPKHAAIFLGSLVVLLALFGVMSGIFLPNPIGFNGVADPLRVVGIIASAIIASVNIAVVLWNHERRMSSHGAGSMTALGAFMGMFLGSCPFCQPAWLFWLGLGSVTGFLSATLGALFGLASIIFLLYALKLSLESDGACGIDREKR
jgi:hypothetical protein